MEQYWIPLACVSMLCNLILAVALKIAISDNKEKEGEKIVIDKVKKTPHIHMTVIKKQFPAIERYISENDMKIAKIHDFQTGYDLIVTCEDSDRLWDLTAFKFRLEQGLV